MSRWLITITVCLLVFAALAGYKFMQIRAAIEFAESFPEPSETVEAARVQLRDVQAYAHTIGETVAPRTVMLRTEIPGRVTAVNFASGERVGEGQILLQLDVSEETARLKAARARAELARLDLRRIRELKRADTVSQERFDQATADYQIATAEVQSLRAVIDKKTLRAPFDARTGIHQFEVGDFLQGNTLITTLVGIVDYLWVDFGLPYKIGSIAEGTEVLVATNREPRRQQMATVVASDSVISAESRTQRFRARLDSDVPIPPNAAVNVSVPVGESVARPHVPLTAVRRDGLGDYVFLLLPDEDAGDGRPAYRARRQSVRIGASEGDYVAILSGVEEGQMVAAHGAFKLRDGLLVYLGQRRVLDAEPES